jgi:hypothetical protein
MLSSIAEIIRDLLIFVVVRLVLTFLDISAKGRRRAIEEVIE